MYLTMWGLSCSTGDLLAVACGIWFPDQGLNPGPLPWEHGVLTAEPPGESRVFILILYFNIIKT